MPHTAPPIISPSISHPYSTFPRAPHSTSYHKPLYFTSLKRRTSYNIKLSLRSTKYLEFSNSTIPPNCSCHMQFTSTLHKNTHECLQLRSHVPWPTQSDMSATHASSSLPLPIISKVLHIKINLPSRPSGFSRILVLHFVHQFKVCWKAYRLSLHSCV